MARGGLVATGLFGAGLALALVVAGAVVASRSCAREAPPPAPPYENARLGEEGAHARGTVELRALGCKHALVMDAARLLGDAAPVRDSEPRLMITCEVEPSGPTPSCDRVEATYSAAVGGAIGGNLAVRVVGSAAGPVCARLYAPSGADLGEYPRP